MVIEYTYSAEDFEEAAAAQTAFFRGNHPVRRAKKIRRSLLGWILFVVLAIILVFLRSRQNNAGSTPAVATAIVSTAPPTQNFLLTLLPALAAPFFTLALLAWTFSKAAAIGRVPLYKPVMETTSRSRIILIAIALILASAGVGAIVAFWFVSSEPDWRPDVLQLFLVYFVPWFAWVIALSVVIKIWQKRLPGKLGHADSSMRLLHRLETGDAQVVVTNSMQRQEFVWAYFVSYLESKNLLLLFTRDLGMMMVPKRAFESEELMLRFCGILQKKISAGQFLPRASRFAVGPAVSTPVPVLPVDTSHQ